jgi:hypothetical protein
MRPSSVAHCIIQGPRRNLPTAGVQFCARLTCRHQTYAEVSCSSGRLWLPLPSHTDRRLSAQVRNPIEIFCLVYWPSISSTWPSRTRSSHEAICLFSFSSFRGNSGEVRYWIGTLVLQLSRQYLSNRGCQLSSARTMSAGCRDISCFDFIRSAFHVLLSNHDRAVCRLQSAVDSLL